MLSVATVSLGGHTALTAVTQLWVWALFVPNHQILQLLPAGLLPWESWEPETTSVPCDSATASGHGLTCGPSSVAPQSHWVPTECLLMGHSTLRAVPVMGTSSFISPLGCQAAHTF